MQYIDYLIIPLSAGIVGYVTNALAIRMLFRPFKPRWYTLGWQGIIPRTRGALAANIARIVGDKLVTAEEIDATIKDPHIQQKLEEELVLALNSEPLQRCADNFIKTGLPQILADKEFAGNLDAASACALSVLAEYLGKMKAVDITAGIAGLNAPALQKHLPVFLQKAVQSYIRSFIDKGGSLHDLTGTINTANIAHAAIEALEPSIAELFSSSGMAEAVSDALIRYKNEQFDTSKTDKMKLGMLNIFFNDGKIKELVTEKLPGIGAQMASDQKLKMQLNIFMVKKLDELMITPIQKLMGASEYSAILQRISQRLAAKLAPEELLKHLSETLEKNTDPDATLNELLQKNGPCLNELLPQTISLSALLQSPNTTEIAARWLSAARHWLAEPKNAERVASLTVSAGTEMAEKTLPAFLDIINISALVEKKINSLDMKQVEDLLFAFMKSHFKWINLLGFVIGFLVGMGQLGFILYNGGQ